MIAILDVIDKNSKRRAYFKNQISKLNLVKFPLQIKISLAILLNCPLEIQSGLYIYIFLSNILSYSIEITLVSFQILQTTLALIG
jgi:membrane protein YdbS with pleckstrin-like domain